MQMILDGQKRWASDGRKIDVMNPATLEVFDSVPDASLEDIQFALECAHRGKEMYSHRSVDDRIDMLMRVAEKLAAHSEELGDLLCRELGRPYAQCLSEAAGLGDFFRFYAEKLRHTYGETLPANNPGDIVMTQREPLGVVFCIVPFNFPLGLYAFKAAPALAAGNMIIVKPASVTPLASIRMTELMLEAGVPKEALQVITGRGERVAEAIAASPFVNAISLTGSTHAGLRIAEKAAANLSRVFLELGGNDPLIIRKDADLNIAVRETIQGRMFNAGQVCCASKRIIVQRDIVEAYVEKLSDALRRINVCDPWDSKSEMGPLITCEAAIRVEEQIRRTLSQGAKLTLGGHRFHENYFEPTILTDVTRDMDIARDMEVFGPVVPVIAYDLDDEAIEIANQSKFGLSGGVIGRDIRAAAGMAMRLQSGTAVVNGCGDYRNLHTPFGGRKMSGIGTEGLLHSLEEMMNTKVIAIRNIFEPIG